MQLSQILFSQGFGTRRICAGLIQHGEVAIDGAVIDDPHHEVEPKGLIVRVSGKDWPYFEKALVLLNKPTGYECSQKPKHHPSVMALLPPPLREREVQPIGRLDEDTTGLLLFTDDGKLIHKLTSPKHHVPKVYEARCKHPVTDEQVAALLAGVELREPDAKPHHKPEQVRAEGAERFDSHGLRLTLTEGKYHQVKRMVAAVGNRVEGLHRSAFGALVLPSDLAPGHWRFLTGPEVLY
ncbi:MAG: 16S rRNA pseudouridine(516) synthase [Burkholderiaceae bacterium]|nr:16S rRNA pseudouridine(516) synthase [Burkholderiaceae bacterium]